MMSFERVTLNGLLEYIWTSSLNVFTEGSLHDTIAIMCLLLSDN